MEHCKHTYTSGSSASLNSIEYATAEILCDTILDLHDMGPNSTACGIRYMSDPCLISRYNYSGRVRLIEANESTQITYRGCVALCGRGNEYYTWPVVSATLTTWILPILGTLLQAPFESNAFWRTVKACNRWIGSPVSSLAAILWDIGISGKCALFGKYRFGGKGAITNVNSGHGGPL